MAILGLLPIPFCNLVVSFSRDKSVKFWGLKDYKEKLSSLKDHKTAVLCTAVSCTGRVFFTGG